MAALSGIGDGEMDSDAASGVVRRLADELASDVFEINSHG